MKKILMGMTTAFMVMSSTTIFAQDLTENNHSTIINFSNDISQETIEKLQHEIKANFTNDMGESIELPTTIIIEDIPQLTKTNEKSYQITAIARTENNFSRKVDSDTSDINKGGINATITLKMSWTDGFGINNTINSLSGSVKDEKHNLVPVTNAYVSYGCYGFASEFKYLRDVTNLFDKPINTAFAAPTAYYKASFSNGYSIDVRVTPTIFS